jgi:hypothetical protein
MKKHLTILTLVGLLGAVPLSLSAEIASSPATGNPPAASGPAAVASSAPALDAAVAAPKADSPGFPLMLKGQEVLFTPSDKREELAARLTKIIGESTPMEEKSRLQYDFQLDPESYPVGLMIDWDAQGAIAEMIVDGENPVVKDLRAWLDKNAGSGKPGVKEDGYQNTVWEHNGWQFTFREGGENEDTAYSFTIVPLKSK